MRHAALLTVFLAAFGFGAQGAVFSLADLAKECSTYESRELEADKAFELGHATGMCDGFIIGLAQGYGYYGLNEKKKEYTLFCIPDGVTNAQLAKSVVSWSAQHPELANQGAAVIAMMLRLHYPCKKP